MLKQEQFDVIALQELFINRDIEFLVRQLPGYNMSPFRSKLFNRSGLFLFSRYPISDVENIPFKMPIITHEIPSHKGIHRCKITIDGKNFQIINTHLAYAPHASGDKLQKHQLGQLVRLLDNRPTFLFGDFNCVHDTLGLPPQFRLISEDKKSSISMANKYARYFLNRVGMSDRLPDYIFTNTDVRVVKTYFITDPIMSDHYPVVSEVVA